MVQWYYARQGETFGPFTPAQLRDLARQGTLLPDDMVSRPGAKKWVPASSIPGLFGEPEPSTAVSPTPRGPVPLTPAADSPWFTGVTPTPAAAPVAIQQQPSPSATLVRPPAEPESAP